jgi:hypothetical protein
MQLLSLMPMQPDAMLAIDAPMLNHHFGIDAAAFLIKCIGKLSLDIGA